MPIQRHIGEFGELDGGGGYSGKNKLQGCKSNQKFYRGENLKWHILQRWKTLSTLYINWYVTLK